MPLRNNVFLFITSLILHFDSKWRQAVSFTLLQPSDLHWARPRADMRASEKSFEPFSIIETDYSFGQPRHVFTMTLTLFKFLHCKLKSYRQLLSRKTWYYYVRNPIPAANYAKISCLVSSYQ
jgi:hypothetical protein